MAAPDRDVGIHLLHAGQLVNGREVQLPLGRIEGQLAIHPGVEDLGEWDRARLPRGADQRHHHFVGDIEGFDQDGFVPL